MDKKERKESRDGKVSKGQMARQEKLDSREAKAYKGVGVKWDCRGKREKLVHLDALVDKDHLGCRVNRELQVAKEIEESKGKRETLVKLVMLVPEVLLVMWEIKVLQVDLVTQDLKENRVKVVVMAKMVHQDELAPLE